VQMVTTPPHQGKFTREMVQAELNRFHYEPRKSRWMERWRRSPSWFRYLRLCTALTFLIARLWNIARVSTLYSTRALVSG
jgi:hypothetical protein